MPPSPLANNPPLGSGRTQHRLYFLLFALLISAISLYELYRSYQARLAEAEYQTQLTASSGAELINRLISHVDLLFPIINDLVVHLPQTADYPAQLRDLLLARQRENPYLMDLLVIDPDGLIQHWTGDGAPPPVLDREYVTTHLHSTSSTRYLGPPLLSKVHLGEWFFAVSHAVRAPDGKLKRILVAIIDIAYIHDALLAMERPNGGSFVLASTDGLIYSRVPDHAQMVGRELTQIKGAVPAGQHRVSGVGQSPLDGQRRAITLTQTDEPELVFIASLALDQVLGPWWRSLWIPVGTLLGVLALIAWLTLHLQRSHLRLVQLSAYDALSGLYNRATFVPLANAELARARRYPRALSLIMIDLDHFKRINDQYGHATGDQVIAAVGELLRNYTRNSDICCRCGGEEFLVLVPETRLLGALELAEQLRQEISALDRLPASAQVKLSASFGVTELHPDDDLDELFSRADKALYQSKHGGRNRVSSAQ